MTTLASVHCVSAYLGRTLRVLPVLALLAFATDECLRPCTYLPAPALALHLQGRIRRRAPNKAWRVPETAQSGLLQTIQQHLFGVHHLLAAQQGDVGDGGSAYPHTQVRSRSEVDRYEGKAIRVSWSCVTYAANMWMLQWCDVLLSVTAAHTFLLYCQ